MGKWKQHPRYNILSFRASDSEVEEIEAVIGNNGNRSAFVLEAVMEKIRRDSQRRKDHALREL